MYSNKRRIVKLARNKIPFQAPTKRSVFIYTTLVKSLFQNDVLKINTGS